MKIASTASEDTFIGSRKYLHENGRILAIPVPMFLSLEFSLNLLNLRQLDKLLFKLTMCE